MNRIYIFFILLIICCTSCSQNKKRLEIRVGIDPNLTQVQSIELKNNIMGFLKDFFLEMPNINFQFIYDDSNELLNGLSAKRYDIIFSDLTPYNFNEQDYNFSEVVVSLAPYPIVRINDNIKDFSHFKNKIIGVQEIDLSTVNFKYFQDQSLKIYDYELNALNDLVNNVIDVALINYLSSLSYLEDTFYNQLKLLDLPLNKRGYRFISPIDENSFVVKLIDQKLNELKINDELDNKWELKIKN